MKQEEFNKIAKDIIRNNIYLTLATADGDPWAAPLFYCVDDRYNFYYISQMDSVHTKHILKNPNVAFAIFDSHEPPFAHGEVGQRVAIEQYSGVLERFLSSDCELSPDLVNRVRGALGT